MPPSEKSSYRQTSEWTERWRQEKGEQDGAGNVLEQNGPT